MKKILKYTFVGLMGCSVLTSCLDSALDTAPTDSMSGTTLLSNANSALIPLNGKYNVYFLVTDRQSPSKFWYQFIHNYG